MKYPALATRFRLLLLVLLLAAGLAEAQENPGGIVRLSGSAAATADVYGFSANDSTLQPRRPSSLLRLVLTPTLAIGDHISLPFNIMLSSQETNVVTPNAKNSTFLQFIQNPLNNLGFLSVAPRIGWLQAYLGTHVPRYSELSAGDEQVFGAGVDLTPGLFRFALSAGSVQRAIEADSANNVRAAYARHVVLGKIGYGDENGTFAHLNLVRAKDDAASLTRRPAGLAPQEGALASLNFRIGVSETVGLSGEAAASAFTRDLNADPVDFSSPLPASMYRQNVSTRSDYAGTLALAWDEGDFGVKTSGKYIGAGYVSLGYPYLQPDRLEFLLAPRARFFDKKLSLNASIGHRTNNLSSTKGATSTQIIGSANAFALISEEWSVALRYANFGVRNNVSNDTLRVETVSNAFSVAPTYTLRAQAATHTITASYALDAFTDHNVVSGAQGSNNTQSVMLMYLGTWTETPLSLTASVHHMTNDLPAGALNMNTLSLGAGTSLFEGAVAPSVTVTYSNNRLASFTADRQVGARAGVQWRIADGLTLSSAVSVNDYRYGSAKPGAFFRETLFESALTTTF